MPLSIPIALGRVELSEGLLRLASGEERSLTPQELGLLAYLAERPGQDVSREELLTEVFGYAPAVRSRAVDDGIKRLRAKLESVPSRPSHLVGVRGVGYRFVPLHVAPVEFGIGARLELPDRVVDLDRLEVRLAEGEPLSLSAREGRFLEVLARHPGHPVDQETLLWEVWGLRSRSQQRLVGKLLYRLRAKLEPDPSAPTCLQTVRGKGICLSMDAPPVRRTAPTGVSAQAPLVKLMGRAGEREAVRQAFASGARLVNLVGPGGAGKTTLALDEAATQWTHARFVDLLGVRDRQALLQAMAEGLGAEGSRPQSLLRALPTWSDALVVLDNAEQCAEALAELLPGWLREVDDARFLITSRRTLGVSVERVVRVGPLSAEAASSLFRARAAAVGVSLGPEDEPLVRQIVAALDGLPLALELAAARLPLLGTQALVERLERPLELLKTTRRDLPERHRSLRAALELSWELLSPAERGLLAGCCVFHGGVGLEEAELLLEGAPEGPAALDLIQSLMDASLLRGVDGPGGHKRLVPYAAVRELALDAVAPELVEGVRHRHLDWLSRRGQDLASGSEPQPQSYPVLRSLLEDGAQAIRFGVQVGRLPEALRCARWVVPILVRRGASERALDLLDHLGETDDVELLRYRATSQSRLGTPEQAPALFEQAVRKAEAAGAVEVAAAALLVWIGIELGKNPKEADRLIARAAPLVARSADPAQSVILGALRARRRFYEGDRDGAWQDTMAALGQLQRLREGWWSASAMEALAEFAYLDERYAEAESWLGMALEIHRDADCAYLVDHVLSFIAVLHQAQGRLTEALSLYSSLLERARRANIASREQFLVYSIGGALGMLGEVAEAARAFQTSLALARQHGHVAMEGWVLLRLAGADWRMGRMDSARAWLGDAMACFEGAGRPVLVEAARTELGRVELMDGELAAAEATLALSVERLCALDGADKHRWLAEALLAEVRLHRGQSSARAALEQAVEALKVAWPREGYARGLVSLGVAQLMDGARQEAQRSLEQAAQIQADLHDQDGDVARAVKRLRASLLRSD